MQGEALKRWMALCEQASKEQDPKKLSKLIEQITRMLEEKAARLNN